MNKILCSECIWKDNDIKCRNDVKKKGLNCGISNGLSNKQVEKDVVINEMINDVVM